MPTPMLSPFNVVDVKNHGAHGDGFTDDTDAIMSALALISNTYVQTVNTGVTIASTPTLLFPHGIYLINKTIDFSLPGAYQTQIKVIGENAIIRPTSDFTGSEAFKFKEAFDIGIEKMNFISFPQTAVWIGNRNPDPEATSWGLNSARITIEGCEFHKNGKALYFFTGSTLLTVEKCKFFHNRMAIDMDGGDQLKIKDCWIESENMEDPAQLPTLRPAQIENRSAAYVLMEATVLVPATAPGNVIEAAWINNRHGSITCTQIRQGSELNPGMTLVNNFSNATPTISGYEPKAVIVKDSQCYSYEDETLRPTIVRYIDAVPNLTIIRNNRGIINGRIMNFSKKKYDDFRVANPGSTLSFNDYARQYIVDTSIPGGDPSSISRVNIVVEISNNVRGIPHDNGSQVPTPLLDFVRDENSLWPVRHRALPVLNTNILKDVNNVQYGIEYTFEYPADISHSMLLVRYSANPWMQGSGAYSGGYAGILKANGAHYNGLTGYFWELRELFNKAGSSNASFINGSFPVNITWDQGVMIDPDANPATPDSFSVLPWSPTGLTAAQRRFTIRFTGTTGDDYIEVIPLENLAYNFA